MASAIKTAPAKRKTVAGKAPEPAPLADFESVRAGPVKVFIRWIALPAIISFGAVFALMLLTLALMTGEINRVDAERGQQAVAAAIDSFRQSLADSAADEGTWNEAYLNTYSEFSPAWLDATWGSTARLGLNYDNVIVTDATGVILFGERNQGPLTGNIADHFSGAVTMLSKLDAAIGEAGDGSVVSHFARSDDGIAALAATVIHQATGTDAPVAASRRRILWLAQHLTPSILHDMAARFRIESPELADTAMPDQQTIPIVDANRTRVSVLNWLPLRPGDVPFLHAALGGSLAMSVVGGMALFMLARLRKGFRRHAEDHAANWRLARYDLPTGLLNQFGLLERLNALLARGPGKSMVAVTYIGVEDPGGLSTLRRGEVMHNLAARFKSAAPRDALVGRLASAQFAFGFLGAEAGAHARKLADTIAPGGEVNIKAGSDLIPIKLSIGVAEIECSAGGAEEPLRLAEHAMLAARAAGGNVAESVVAREDQARLDRLAAEIRAALDKDEFDLDYQPIFDFASQSMLAVEAVVRWKGLPDGEQGALDVMAAAQSSGLAEELGLLTLRRAARDIAPFDSLMLCVGVSPGQFRNSSFSEKVNATLAATKFPAARLQVEITEAVLRDHPKEASSSITELRSHGIAVALGDFGAGESALSHLQSGVDRVKLARSIVGGVDSDPMKAAMARSIVAVAQAAGVKAGAEGVDRREEAAFLAGIGYREFQGLLFAPPMTIEALARLLQPAIRKAG